MGLFCMRAPSSAGWRVGCLGTVALVASLRGLRATDPEPFAEEEEQASAGVVLLQTSLEHQRRAAARTVDGALPSLRDGFHDAGLSRRLSEMPTPGALVEGSSQAPPGGEAQDRAASSAQAGRRVDGLSQAFVQLFEWSWDDVAKECEEFLGPKGFNAVQVSPASEHIQGEGWYTRYQPVSYNLTSRSGNEAQFASMLRRCRAAGVGVYADAVFNQQAFGSGTGIAGTKFGFRTYPLYAPEDFHHLPDDMAINCGVDDYHSKFNVQNCDLQGMPDLCTGCSHVQDTVAAYINRMGQLGISGFRVDAAKHMDPTELGQLLAKVDGNLYRYQEVTASPGEAVQSPPYFRNGAVTEFGFVATLAPKFMGKGLLRDDLKKFGEAWGLSPSSDSVVFLDNHDSQRNGASPLTYKSGPVYDLTNMFMLAYPYGYPKVMSSYYFETSDQGPPKTPVHGPNGELGCGPGKPWVCEHRRPQIANMVAWRRTAGQAPVQSWDSEGDVMSFCRGRSACIAFNLREKPWVAKLQWSVPAGEYCDVSQSDAADCPRVRVAADGTARVQVPARGAVAVHTGAARLGAAAEAVGEEEAQDLEDALPLD